MRRHQITQQIAKQRRDALQINQLSAQKWYESDKNSVLVLFLQLMQVATLNEKLKINIIFILRLKIAMNPRQYLHQPILLEVFQCDLLLVSFRAVVVDVSSLILVAPGSTFCHSATLCMLYLLWSPRLAQLHQSAHSHSSCPSRENGNQCKWCAHLLVPSRLLTLKCRLWVPRVFANCLQIILRPVPNAPLSHMGSGTVYTLRCLSCPVSWICMCAWKIIKL